MASKTKTSSSTSTVNPEDPIDFGFTQIPAAEKAGRVRGVFDSVASSYDVMNDAMSFGVHRVWKNMTMARVNPQPGEVLLDVAGGTGDLARRFLARAEDVAARRIKASPPARAIVCDINAEMLLAGQSKDFDDRGKPLNISRVCGDAQNLPLPKACVDVVTIAFGIRNVTDRPKALADMYRVLKPGGRFFVLEFSTPPADWLSKAYDLYSFNVIPRMGQIIAKDKDSYQYLVESIRKFPLQPDFAQMVKEAGFSRVSWTDFSGGVAALHQGWKI
jgi:demethylmenaquinone methyltransferase / 2-methoxy-6-polyprenyl-1,4-benzoquinol methylase